MKRQLVKIRQNLYWIIWVFCTLLLLSFTSRKQKEREIKNIHIHVENQLDNFFLESEDIKSLMTKGNKKIIIGLTKKAINLNKYESLIRANNFVREVSVSTTHGGDIYVYVEENRPVARVFDPRKSYYIDETGTKMPLSHNYTSRNLIIFDKRKQSDSVRLDLNEYLTLINFINKDELWKKQIAEMEIDRKGRVFLYPQVGKQKISFGYPEKIEEKFEKLNVFFKKILPSVGWNRYNLVKLEFNEQIVCE